ncbi:hypothetical protein BG011_006801 [Mortierella polycephala]|uniref:Uncharacterized protein n=1 Tax=Mortierella polycephala TaxID=41804 RepID=A0A9P6U7W9_9FUNG|nr:hypothetical protein BG011_006801 [Mortierella polycephala]
MSDLSASKWSTEAFSFSTPTPRSSAPSRPASTTVSSTEQITVPETFQQMVHSVATKSISTANVGTYTENRNNNQGRTTSTQPSHGSLTTGANTPKLQSTFVNPYQAYVKNLDPDGALGDGRDYVGKKSHHLDRPTAPTAANPRPAGTFGAQTLHPPVQKAPAPAPKRNFFMNSKNSVPSVPGLDFGTAKPRPPPGAPSTPSTGVQNNQRRRPSASSASSSSSKPGRDYNKAHAWSGKPLATTEDFDFFGTAKPKLPVNPPERPSQTRKPLGNNNNHFNNDRSNNDRSNNDRSNNDRNDYDGGNNDRGNNDRGNNDRGNNDRGNNDRGNNDRSINDRGNSDRGNNDRSINDRTDNDGDNNDRNNNDRNNNDRSNNVSAPVSPPPAPFTQRPGSENGWNDTPQHGIRQYDAQQQVFRAPQQRPQQRAPGQESGEWNDFRNTAQHYLDALENTSDTAGSKPFISSADDVKHHRIGLAANRHAAHGAAAKAEPSDNPIFMQYPIGDGCHLTLAMYVDRDPDTALHRFQGMTRYRQSSTYKEQSIDEMTEIFKKTLMDEKENVSG